MPETQPYLPRNPGDPVTAEDWNDLQHKIQTDITVQVDAAKDDVRKTGVDKAGDADNFAGKSGTGWLQELDQRYAPRSHDHEGQSVYRRYVKNFTTDPGLDQVLLTHKLGRYPLVDIYELKPTTADFKLFFYYGHTEDDTYGLIARVGRERRPIGVPFDEILAELGVEYRDDSAIGDVVNEMWDKFREDPNDEVKHGVSTWINQACGADRTVREIKRAQQWDDLRLALRPTKPVAAVEVEHVDYDTVWIRATALTPNVPLDLMILLRV
jgi:hypothetical protein